MYVWVHVCMGACMYWRTLLAEKDRFRMRMHVCMYDMHLLEEFEADARWLSYLSHIKDTFMIFIHVCMAWTLVKVCLSVYLSVRLSACMYV